ncbi:hypothetical protein ABZP36_017031 [Zizania latifolia]
MVELIEVLEVKQEEGIADSHGEEDKAEKGHLREEKTEKVKRRRRRKRVYDPQRKRACVDCTMRCVRVHGRASSSKKATLPSFFKIMIGYFSEIMEIPRPFARTIADLTGSNVYLEDAFGLRWRVRLCLHDGVLSFGHGWKNFVLDHDIGAGEFLVFRQIARSVFTVQIFALSACERMHLCEKNKRQSRKRKPRQRASRAANPKVKKGNEDANRHRKKQRVEQRNDLGPSQCGKLSVLVCIDSGSELRCSESSEKELDVAEVANVPKSAVDDCTTECNATGIKVLESMAAIAASSNTKDMTGDANKSEDYPGSYSAAKNVKNAQTDNLESSNMAANTELRAPLAMMDLNEVSIDDMFLSAEMYEFDSDFFGPEAFSIELNTRGVATKGQTSGDWDCSMGAGHCSGMPETSTCLENKQVAEAQRASTDVCSVAVQGIDINTLPSNQISAFGQDNSPPDIDAEVLSTERELDACKKDKAILSFSSEGNQVAQKADSSVKQDILQDGARQTTAEFMSSSPKPCKLPVKRKNCVQPGSAREILAELLRVAGTDYPVCDLMEDGQACRAEQLAFIQELAVQEGGGYIVSGTALIKDMNIATAGLFHVEPLYGLSVFIVETAMP